ncbi:MAG: spore germination protein, partial [Candidatus Contubernalis sp.]|nr:spore germination protein [Candidatus Contubernalis sp.]
MKFIKQLSRLFPRKKQNSSDKGKDSSKDMGSDMDRLDISQLRDLTVKEKLKTKLQDNLSLVQQYQGNSMGLKIREIRIGPDNIKAAVIFIDGMVDSASVDELLSSVFISSMKSKELPPLGDQFLKYLKDKVIPSTMVEEVTELNDFFDRVLIGDTALVIDGLDTALVAETKGWKTRAIDESDAEISIRGPREAFVESINDNLSLLRRRIRVPQLWVEKFTVGSLTRTQVAVVYIKGLAGEEILKELRSRIEKADTDSILDSGQLEEFIEDTPFTLFPLTLRTERPDRISAALLEGQVAIIVDGTPFALTVPITLFAHLQAPEDHFERVPVGFFIRTLRFAAILIALFLPGVYVAVVNFHHELIPTDLFLRIASNREGIPFPIVVEMLI